MNRLCIFSASLLLALLGTSSGTGQAPGRVGFVHLTRVFEAHPKGKALAELNQKYNAQLQEISVRLHALEKKQGALTGVEKQSLNVLQEQAKTLSDTYQKEAAPLLKPLSTELTQLVKTTAKAQGFGIVMDQSMASKIVIYASETTNLTDQVIASISKPK